MKKNIETRRDKLHFCISKMLKKDLPTLLRFGKAQWPTDDWLTMKYLTSSFVQPGLNLVARLNNQTIGGVMLVYDDIEKNWVRYLIVEKKYRRLGIARAMFRELFKSFKPGESLFVDTGVIDKKAIAFYEKLGFKIRGRIRSFYDRQEAFILEKNITKKDLL